MRWMKIKIKLFLVLLLAVWGSSVYAIAGNGTFDNFINNSAPTANTNANSDFDTFVNQNSGGNTGDGPRRPTSSLSSDSFVSEQSNVGGSIYIPYEGPVFTGPGLEGGALLTENELDDNVSKERDVKVLIIGWTNFLLQVTALLAVVALVYAGFLYVTAGGDDSRMESAKKIVIWVVVGILVILGSYAIVNTVMEAVF